MSESQRFRRDPHDLLRPPIVGDDGVNPFAESGSTRPVSDNLYQAPPADDEPTYQPSGYLPTLVPHSRRVFRFGLLGLILAVTFAAMLAGGVMSSQESWVPTLRVLAFCCSLADLALTLGAFILGINEVRAIDAGAVAGSNRAQARTGIVLGVLGTIVCIATAAAFVYHQFFVLSLSA